MVLQAAVNVPTQPAQIRATDLTTGNADDRVVHYRPANRRLRDSVCRATKREHTGPDKVTCSTGFEVDYFIYGGTPPYHISSTFPNGVTLFNSTVSFSGGSFRAITNGTCLDPLVFTIVDATGLQTTAQLTNAVGTATPVVPTGPVQVTPASVTVSGSGDLQRQIIRIHDQGGTAPFSVASPDGLGVPESSNDLAGNIYRHRIPRRQPWSHDLYWRQ